MEKEQPYGLKLVARQVYHTPSDILNGIFASEKLFEISTSLKNVQILYFFLPFPLSTSLTVIRQYDSYMYYNNIYSNTGKQNK
jgi:hypothetical protein